MGLAKVAAACILAPAASIVVSRGGQAQLDGPSDAGQWDDMSCFMDLSRVGIKGSEANVIFRAGKAAADGTPEVLVLQETMDSNKGVHRTLVFRSSDGKCNPQSGSLCSQIDSGSMGSGDTGGLGADAAALDMGGTDKCDSLMCHVDVRSGVMETGSSYIRSMVGTLALLSEKSDEGGCAAPAPKRVVSVGFGSGTLALLVHALFPGAQQTVVELSSGVAQAGKCFGVVGDEFELITEDGRAYIESSPDGSIDAIFVDAFDGEDKVPSCFTTSEFFATVKQKLRPKGVLSMNAHSGKTLHSDVDDLLPAAKKVFGDVLLGQAPGLGNVIVAAVAQPSNSTSGSQPTPCVDGDAAQGPAADINEWYSEANFQSADSSGGSVRTDASIKRDR